MMGRGAGTRGGTGTRTALARAAAPAVAAAPAMAAAPALALAFIYSETPKARRTATQLTMVRTGSAAGTHAARGQQWRSRPAFSPCSVVILPSSARVGLSQPEKG